MHIASHNQITAILQARMSSSRLPGKVLKKLHGKPMLQQQIERIQRSQRIQRLLVATSDKADDDPIEKLCQSLHLPCFRGNLNDVLDRYYQASQQYPSAHIVRLTGDCPLIDPKIIDTVVEYHLAEDADYTSNCAPPTLPDGLDIEIFKQAALHSAWQESQRASEREHVTLYLRNHPERFKLANYRYSADLSNLRWTVDNQEDFDLIAQIYSALLPNHENFGLEEIVALLQKRPELKTINQHISRNQGLEKSLAQEKGIDHE